MDDSAPRLAMVAGEASGDLLAALLLGGLKTRWPALRAFGIGGPRMSAHGFDAWWPHDRLAVRGYVEVLRHYREIAGIRNALGERLLRERPDAFIGVDAPDFNLGLELLTGVENVSVKPFARGHGRELRQVHIRRQPEQTRLNFAADEAAIHHVASDARQFP